ncbi:MAG TPA: hypothetical protein VNL77_18665 [Roseiflexaceae bacterium]|nr:hypothetical protein [Roseiflexaceae bacterium]
MTVDLAALDYVRQLRRTGLRPGEKLAQHILRAGEAAVGPLIELACDTALLEAEAPECYGPLHALRLLGELRPARMVEPLVRAYAPDPADHDPPLARSMWEGELPQILGRLGEQAVAALWSVVDDPAYTMDQRAVALTGLAYATAAAPELRGQVVAGLRERLAASEDTTLSGHLIAALANLGAAEAYQEVMARFRAGQVDLAVANAAQARQLLLTPNPGRLRCANHPLWERYDEHGPFPEAPER